MHGTDEAVRNAQYCPNKSVPAEKQQKIFPILSGFRVLKRHFERNPMHKKDQHIPATLSAAVGLYISCCKASHKRPLKSIPSLAIAAASACTNLARLSWLLTWKLDGRVQYSKLASFTTPINSSTHQNSLDSMAAANR